MLPGTASDDLFKQIIEQTIFNEKNQMKFIITVRPFTLVNYNTHFLPLLGKDASRYLVFLHFKFRDDSRSCTPPYIILQRLLKYKCIFFFVAFSLDNITRLSLSCVNYYQLRKIVEYGAMKHRWRNYNVWNSVPCQMRHFHYEFWTKNEDVFFRLNIRWGIFIGRFTYSTIINSTLITNVWTYFFFFRRSVKLILPYLNIYIVNKKKKKNYPRDEFVRLSQCLSGALPNLPVNWKKKNI